MRVLFLGKMLLLSGCLVSGSLCCAQGNQQPAQPAKYSIDLGVTFAGELSRPDTTLSSFWFKGGGVDAAATFWKGFGVAATVTGDHASNYLPSTDENKVSLLAGPRYTFTAWKGHSKAEDQRRLQLFGQGLAGVAHGFDTRFTTGSTSANELAIQTGGGLNYFFTKKFGIRPIEVEFVRTQIGFTGFSTQNDMRLASGVIYHF